MANFVKRVFNNTDINGLKSFFDGLNNPLLSTAIEGTVLKITVDNNVTINMTVLNAQWLNPITITYNGSTTSEIARQWFANNGCEMTICSSDTLFYIQSRDNDGRRFGFVYEKIGSDAYFAYKGSQNSTGVGFYDITSFSFTKIGDANTTYSHGAILNYTTTLGFIDFMPEDMVFASGVKIANDPNFKACTTITANTVITVQGKNYYTVGGHSLVEMSA